jgi:uncharacterized protein
VTPAAALIVIAKEPRPGLVKTRLSPPCSPPEAAALAAAALADTLAAAGSAPAARRVLALDGEPGPWVPDTFEVIPQASGSLDARLAAAIEAVGDPALVIGMDTPQVTSAALAAGLEAVIDPAADAVLGPAADGGYWAIGLRRPDGAAVAGVPMSVSWTAAAQRARLSELGLRWRELHELRDVDTYADARVIAGGWPGTRFAGRLREIEAGWRSEVAAAPGG